MDAFRLSVEDRCEVGRVQRVVEHLRGVRVVDREAQIAAVADAEIERRSEIDLVLRSLRQLAVGRDAGRGDVRVLGIDVAARECKAEAAAEDGLRLELGALEPWRRPRCAERARRLPGS